MVDRRIRRGLPELHRAFDEARFGRERTLNLRETLPRPVEAERRAESWLRERQVARAGEVLVITGRGNQSYDGISAVRASIATLLGRLKRKGVVSAVEEHTPGSFVVRLAPLGALRNAPARSRGFRNNRPPADPAALAGLSPETLKCLRRLALRSLEELGAHDPSRFVEAEMVAQFSAIAAGVPEGPDREFRLRDAIDAVTQEYDDAPEPGSRVKKVKPDGD